MKKILKFSAFLAMVVGLVLVAGGVWGVYFTYKNVTAEKITTPTDASIPGVAVTGPLTLKSQSDVIRHHTLNMTGGKTYAEMPRQIQKTDESGNMVVDKEGKPVMVDNAARGIWITATTLTTALHLGIVTYAFSLFVFLIGLISIWNSIIFCRLADKGVFVQKD